ncbi:hypothetical protein ACKVM9_002202 [Pantoea agglomerans]|uniref:hypothetical protein n=1 Tax=Enterobacter agglomerans TaxID=549 RepID=UPI003909953E
MPDQSAIVTVNGIDVGVISLEKYQSIVQGVKKEKGYRTREVLTFIYFMINTACRTVTYFFITVMALAVIAMMYLYYSPGSLHTFLVFARNGSQETISSVIKFYIYHSALIAFIVSGLSTISKGYTSAAQISINKRLRMIFSIPVEGRIALDSTCKNFSHK